MELPIMIIRHGAAHYDYKTLFMKSTIDEYIYIYIADIMNLIKMSGI